MLSSCPHRKIEGIYPGSPVRPDSWLLAKMRLCWLLILGTWSKPDSNRLGSVYIESAVE